MQEDKFIAKSPILKEILNSANLLKTLQVNALISGDLGTGKKTLAKQIDPNAEVYDAKELQEDIFKNKGKDGSNTGRRYPGGLGKPIGESRSNPGFMEQIGQESKAPEKASNAIKKPSNSAKKGSNAAKYANKSANSAKKITSEQSKKPSDTSIPIHNMPQRTINNEMTMG